MHDGFVDKKIRRKYEEEILQKVATLASCFQTLLKFQFHFSLLILKIEFMINIMQLEFLKLELIWPLIQ